MPKRKQTAAAPYQIEIETILPSGRAVHRKTNCSNLETAVQWCRDNGWCPSPNSYILRNPNDPRSVVIMKLLDFDGIGANKARYGTMPAAALMASFAAGV